MVSSTLDKADNIKKKISSIVSPVKSPTSKRHRLSRTRDENSPPLPNMKLTAFDPQRMVVPDISHDCKEERLQELPEASDDEYFDDLDHNDLINALDHTLCSKTFAPLTDVTQNKLPDVKEEDEFNTLSDEFSGDDSILQAVMDQFEDAHIQVRRS